VPGGSADVVLPVFQVGGEGILLYREESQESGKKFMAVDDGSTGHSPVIGREDANRDSSP